MGKKKAKGVDRKKGTVIFSGDAVSVMEKFEVVEVSFTMRVKKPIDDSTYWELLHEELRDILDLDRGERIMDFVIKQA